MVRLLQRFTRISIIAVHPGRGRGMHGRVTASVVLALLAAAPGALAAGDDPAAGWQDYVLAPRTATPQPVRVARVIGDVRNAAALTAGGSGSATFTSPPGGTKATVVLDFGEDVGGTPQVTVDSV